MRANAVVLVRCINKQRGPALRFGPGHQACRSKTHCDRAAHPSRAAAVKTAAARKIHRRAHKVETKRMSTMRARKTTQPRLTLTRVVFFSRSLSFFFLVRPSYAVVQYHAYYANNNNAGDSTYRISGRSDKRSGRPMFCLVLGMRCSSDTQCAV